MIFGRVEIVDMAILKFGNFRRNSEFSIFRIEIPYVGSFLDLINWKYSKKWKTIQIKDPGIVEILEITHFKNLGIVEILDITHFKDPELLRYWK